MGTCLVILQLDMPCLIDTHGISVLPVWRWKRRGLGNEGEDKVGRLQLGCEISRCIKKVTPETEQAINLLNNVAAKALAHRNNLLLIKNLQKLFFY